MPNRGAGFFLTPSGHNREPPESGCQKYPNTVPGIAVFAYVQGVNALHPALIADQRFDAFEQTPKGSTCFLTISEEAEFTALVQRQSRFVFQVAYAVLLNAHDAEDAVQETFLKLYRNRGWRNLGNERAFLARVAWRVAVDRRPRRQETVSIEAEPDRAAVIEPPSPDPGPEQALITADRQARIHALIDALPEELRIPLVLTASDELNSREIGRILRVPEGTVRSRLQRARQLLRQKLGAAGQHLRMPGVQEAPYV